MKRLMQILLVLLLFITCKKTDNNSPNPSPTPTPTPTPTLDTTYTLAPSTYIIDNPTAQLISTVDSSQITFSGSSAQLGTLKVGDNIICGITPTTPVGFLRRISSITGRISSNTRVTSTVFKTVEIALIDAFKNLHIDKTMPLGTFDVPIKDIVLYDVDKDLNTTNDQIKLNGSIQALPQLHLKIDISNFVLQYSKVEGIFPVVISEGVTAGASLGIISIKKNILPSHPLAAITAGPIVIIPFFSINVGADASVNINVSASETKTATITGYLEYTNGSWSPGYTKDVQSVFNFSGLNGIASAKVYVQPAIDFKFYGSNWAKGSITADGYIKAT